MRNSRLLNIGLSIILTATAIAGGTNNSSIASAKNQSGKPSRIAQMMGSNIKLYGGAEFGNPENITDNNRSLPEEVTIVFLPENGGMSYSPSTLESPIVIFTVDDDLDDLTGYAIIQPLGSQANLETPKVTYVSDGRGAQAFVGIYSLTDFIATKTSNIQYISYSNSKLYHTPDVSFAKTSSIQLVAVNSIEEITQRITKESAERLGREILETLVEQAKRIDISDIIIKVCKLIPKVC